MTTTTYQDTLDFLYSQLPMYSRVGRGVFKKGLKNTLALCEFFDNPQDKFRSIHIGGTNGKGSVTNFIASMLSESKLSAGIYTSPHLFDFRERIKIGNRWIEKDFIVDFVERARPIIKDLTPSFFELTVVMAFQYFALRKVDLAVIEVGLGGRLDSTNVLRPDLSVITNVSFDHMNMLGNTIESIANEKAGIIKKNTPVIVGESDLTYNTVFEKEAAIKNAELVYADKIVECTDDQTDFIELRLEEIVVRIGSEYAHPNYQLKNIKTAIVAFSSYLLKNPLDDLNRKSAIEKGIQNRTKNTGFMGRWTQIIFRDRTIILESAHNEAGIVELNRTIKDLKFKRLVIIYATVNDKDISKIVSLLPKNADYVLTESDIPRALSIEDLSDLFAENMDLTVLASFSKSSSAIDYAIDNSNSSDTILVTGSIFIVGELLKFIHRNK